MADFRTHADRLPRPPRGAIGTIVKLAIASAVVGLVLGALGINPVELWRDLWRMASEGVRDAFDMGTGWVAVTLAAMVTGAVIVVPIWLLRLILRGRR